MNFRDITPLWFDEIDSTNAEAMRMLKSEKPPEGTCICAHYQHHGKGQRANQWQSRPGENLLVSFILYPPNHAAEHPFLLSKSVALAVHRTIENFARKQVDIKWPNDILLDNRKAAGILIENQWLGSHWNAAVVGIGINVNQQGFQIEHATSLASASEREIPIASVLSELQGNISREYQRLQRSANDAISADYNALLFGRDDFHTYNTDSGSINAKVLRVLADGRLELITDKNERLAFDLSEIQLVY